MGGMLRCNRKLVARATIRSPKTSQMISLDRYTALLARPELRQTIVASMIGRLPIGITGLAILLLVQEATASFAQGGAASAGYVLGLATLAPVIGRLIDRQGPRLPLLACAIAFPAALASLVIAVHHAASQWAIILCAAAAGGSFPPITVCMRTYFRQRLRDEELLTAAYSLESVLIELIFIVGPLLVALFVGLASASAAVLFAAACGSIGTLLFLRSPPLAGWQVEAHAASRRLLGPLADPGFPALLAVILCYSTAFGALEVGLTAYATERGNAALAGVLLGLMSAGSALGGLAYGSRSWGLPLRRQFVLMLALMGAGLAALALPWSTGPFALWSFFAGVAIAPALIVQSMLVASTVRPAQLTEAFTWSTSALLAGVGIGVAAGGALLEFLPSSATLAAAAAAALVAAAAACVLREA